MAFIAENRHYVNKLFGGPMNAKRVERPMDERAFECVKTARHRPLSFVEPGAAWPAIETCRYTRRFFGGKFGTVEYFAHRDLSNEEAHERLWRFLMRTAKATEIDGSG